MNYNILDNICQWWTSNLDGQAQREQGLSTTKRQWFEDLGNCIIFTVYAECYCMGSNIELLAFPLRERKPSLSLVERTIFITRNWIF